ncbi:MAG: DUF2341 domain-containing protein [Patescibacteria group bacterium]|nr:DUF2341 domain-containing protein [Patescibacteria group bacterium]
MAPNANLLLAATEEQVGIVDNTTVGDFLNETPGDSIPTSFDAQNEQVQGFDDTQITDNGIAADVEKTKKEAPTEESDLPGQTAMTSIQIGGDDPLGFQETQQGLGGSAKANLPNVQSNTGDLIYEYRISVPPGRLGLQPDLKIVYDSQSRQEGGIYGSNWSDNIPYIVRNQKMGVDRLYSTSTPDFFSSYWDNELATTTDAQVFVPRTEEGSFRVYTFTSSTNQWIVQGKGGTQYKFGYTTSSRQDDPEDATRVYKWMLEEARDTNDNYIKYTYTKESGQIYPSSIIYTGNGETDGIFEVDFVTSTRDDIATSTKTGFDVRSEHRISEIDVKVGGSLVRSYSFGYEAGDNGYRSLLATVVETGVDESEDPIVSPTTTFSYSSQIPGWSTSSTWYPPVMLTTNTFQDLGYRVGDVNGDGLPEMIRSYYAGAYFYEAWINNGHGWTSDSTWYPPVELATNTFQDLGYRIVDVNGDGYADIIRGYHAGSDYYGAWINTGSGWDYDSTWIPPGIFATDSTNDTGYRISDINGDGLPDMIRSYNAGSNVYEAWINNGHGWDSDSSWYPPVLLTTNTGQDLGYVITDVNGDGLPDMIRSYNAGSNVYEAWINNGHGWDSDSSWYPPVLLMSNTFQDIGYRVVDINGDGLPDIIRGYDDGAGHYTNEAYINNGHGWDSDSDWLPPVQFSVYPGTNAGYFITDVDGDGMPDFVRSYDAGTSVYEAKSNDGTTNSLLHRITFPEGGCVSFTYKPIAQYTNEGGGIANKSPSYLPTVSAIAVDDAFGNIATTTYSYSGAERYYNGGHDTRFAGFASSTVVDAQGNVTKTYFHQGNSSDSAHGEYNDEFAKIGRVYRVEKYDVSGNLYQKTINKWDSSSISDSDADFLKLAQTVDYTYDGDSSHKDKAVTYTYDGSTGNLTEKVEYGLVVGSDNGTFSDSGSDEHTTSISYASSASSTVRQAVKQITVTDHDSATVKDTKYYYDGLSFGAVDEGNQTKEEDWVTGSEYVDLQKTYDSYGLVATATDSRGKVTSYTNDEYDLYPARVTDPLSHVTQYQYDYTNGKPKQVTDPNGLISQTIFDGLDRVLQQKAPDLTTSSTLVVIESFTYTDTPGAVSILDSKQITSTTTADNYSYYDGLGRLIQTRDTAAIASSYVIKDREYNSLGLLDRESLPYFGTGTSLSSPTSTQELFTSYAYDPLQRVHVVTNAVGSTTSTYSDWITTLTDANGHAKELVYDAYKRLIEVDEHNATTTYQTYYEYDGNGSLTKVTDALANIREFTYDGLGNRLTAEDLHASADETFGSWSYTYDDAGNLISQTDPSGQTVNYTYDDINRLLTVDYTGESGTEVVYTYDNCDYGIGSLCVASSTSIRIEESFNPRKLLSSETKTIAGTGYTSSYTYDRQGNRLTLTNPDGSQIRYTYSGGQYIGSIEKKETTDGSFVSIIDDVTYAPTGQMASISFANGVAQTNTYDPAELYRLTQRISALPSSSHAQDLTYEYDAVGNITQIDELGDTNNERTVDYGYDDLDRLTTASATGTPTGISGYENSFSYDAIGNLTSSELGEYTYAGNTGSLFANPSAATAIGSLSLSYDENGNLITTSVSTSGWSVNGGTWNRRRAITIDHNKVSGSGDLTDFPMLFASVDSDLRTSENGGSAEIASGDDFFFTLSDGTTKLDHEIESYSSTTGALTAWVSVPNLSSATDTVLYLYYGNASSTDQQNQTGAWDGDTKGVWHFNDSLDDSTSYGNDGTNSGSTNLENGKIGEARDFTGSWDTATVAESPTLEPSSEITISMWMKQTGEQPDWAKPLWYGNDTQAPWGSYGFYVDTASDVNVNLNVDSDSSAYGTWPPATLATSTWQYVVGTYDGTYLKLYVDGELVSSAWSMFTIGNYDATHGLSFGSSWDKDADWHGFIDEVNIASTTRSGDWIKTAFDNQDSPSSFYTLGTASGNGWYATGGTWNNRKQIVVDHTRVSPDGGSTLTDFPLLVSVTDADLKTIAYGGEVGKSDGSDILFTSSDGLTKFDHEIESYSSTTGELVAWVSVPTLSSVMDTNLFVYFGNSSASDQQNKTGVWDSDTKGVWHFNNNTLDSTSNSNDGYNHGSTNLASGKIGAARDLTNAWDTVTVTSTPTLQPSTALTFSLWINQYGTQPDWVRPIQYGQDSVNPWGAYNFYIDANSDTALNFALGSVDTSYGLGTAQLTTSTWQYVVGTFDGSSMKFYLDGELLNTRTDSFSIGDYDGSSGLSFGSSWSDWSDWTGYLDEVRVASTTRSADWIKTEYNNQSTSGVLAFGALQSVGDAETASGPTEPVSTFSWDYQNRLTQYVDSQSTSTYTYDPSGNRIQMSVENASGTVTTIYPTKEYDLTDGAPTKHVFLNGVEVVTIEGTGASSTVYTVLTDHLSGSSVITDSSGNIAETSDYYPYGAIRLDEQEGFDAKRKYAGHVYDASTKLSYMGARYYDPSIGKFLSQDAAFRSLGDSVGLKENTELDQQTYLSNPQTNNSYSYSFGNPLVYRDSDGNFAFLAAAAAYATAYAPVWIPGAVTAVSAVGATVATWNWGSAVGNLVEGNNYAADQNLSNVNAALGMTAMGAGGLMAADTLMSPKITGQRERLSSIATRIGNGHAYDKHVLEQGQFVDIVKNRSDFTKHVYNVMKNPDEYRQLSGGRAAYWQWRTNSIIITDPKNNDAGTAFQPFMGYDYFKNLK